MNGPFLTTERLELWQPQAHDEIRMYDIVANPATHRFLGGMAARADHYTRFQRGAGSWFLQGFGSFMVRLRDDPALIGSCGVFQSYRGLGTDFDDKPEGGWIISADHVGKGIAREAMEAALAWFDAAHGPREVVCMIDPDNAPSIALASKLGFQPNRETALPDGSTVRLFSRPPVTEA